MPGPPPEPASKRRRSGKPKSYGAAEPTTVPASLETKQSAPRDRGIDHPHPLITAIWDTVAQSCESAFYSEADWVRLRLELWHANREMASDRPSANAWTAVQHGFDALLLSPAVKRRAGIEVQSTAVDADEVAAVSLTGKYQQKLKSV